MGVAVIKVSFIEEKCLSEDLKEVSELDKWILGEENSRQKEQASKQMACLTCLGGSKEASVTGVQENEWENNIGKGHRDHGD